MALTLTHWLIVGSLAVIALRVVVFAIRFIRGAHAFEKNLGEYDE